MDVLTILSRTILFYLLILIIFRVMGKREIGELSVLDLVVFIMLAEIAVISIEDIKLPIIHTIVPMLALLVLQFSTSYLSLKSQAFRDLVDGRPSVLIENGQIREKEMKRQRYNFNDLLVQLREKEVKDISEVEYAILEPSGKLSVFPKQNQETKSPPPEHPVVGFPVPLIIDGKMIRRNLERAQKDEAWLREHLQKLGYVHIEKLSYCSIDERGKLYVDEKDEA